MIYGTGENGGHRPGTLRPLRLPFEIATVLLLLAIIGAVLMSRKPERDQTPES